MILFNKYEKIIFKIMFILFLNIIYSVEAEFRVCDSSIINFNWKTTDEICSFWTQTWSIIWINNFNWEFINYDLWYFWNNRTYFWTSEIKWFLPFWYFDNYKKIVVTKTNFSNDNTDIWYFWTNFSFTWKIIETELLTPLWFFDNTKRTYIKTTNTNFDFAIWYLLDYKIIEVKKNSKNNDSEILITYRDFFKKIFDDNFYIAVQNGVYEKDDYDKFVNDFLDLFFIWSWFENKLVDEKSRNRINQYVENWDFRKTLWKISKNIKEINIAFKTFKEKEERFYIIKYYLDE